MKKLTIVATVLLLSINFSAQANMKEAYSDFKEKNYFSAGVEVKESASKTLGKVKGFFGDKKKQAKSFIQTQKEKHEEKKRLKALEDERYFGD